MKSLFRCARLKFPILSFNDFSYEFLGESKEYTQYVNKKQYHEKLKKETGNCDNN